MTTFTVKIEAGVEAEDANHAELLVALDLLSHAFSDPYGHTLPFGPRVPGGYVNADVFIEAVTPSNVAQATER